MNPEIYLFRRQFLLSPYKIVSFDNWIKKDLPDGYHLAVHPDLPVTNVKTGCLVVTLLGFLIDPLNPERDDAQIIRALFEKNPCEEEIFEKLNFMSGRFVLIIQGNGRRIILNDAMGFRQVFYYIDKKNKCWCASQPSILAELLDIELDQDLQRGLQSIPTFARGEEYWYPGDMTAYKGIVHLTPNHYYDFKENKKVRYWPSTKITSLSVEECVEKVAFLLRGIYSGAIKRFKIAQTITCGLDSRILLAASRMHCGDIYFFTHTHKKLDVSGNDIVIPSKMLLKLGLEHHIAFHIDVIDPVFEGFYRRNVSMARKEKERNAYAIFRHFADLGKEYVVINGVGGEITRQFFFLPKFVQINGLTLSALSGMGTNKTSSYLFDRWLQGSELIKDLGYNLLDLFYWEQRVGSWAAMSYSEYDLVFESFSPLNCRKIFELAFGVRKNFRSPPNYELHRLLIKNLWPQTLEFPINPPISKTQALVRMVQRSSFHSVIKTLRFLQISKFSPFLRKVNNGM
jgi:hypothetical protein